jgi:succinyl-CoA synthetase beta subunit
MNIHEHQAKTVLREFGLPVPRGRAILSADDTETAAQDLYQPA